MINNIIRVILRSSIGSGKSLRRSGTLGWRFAAFPAVRIGEFLGVEAMQQAAGRATLRLFWQGQ